MAEKHAHVRRMARSKKRDPRLIAGIALILASMLVGALSFVTLSATTDVVVARQNVAQGDVLDPAHFTVTQVRIADADAIYVSSLDEIPAGALATSNLGPGELLARSHVGQVETSALRPVSIDVEQHLASSLTVGAVVEVWHTASEGGQSRVAVERAFVRAIDHGGGLGMQATSVEVLVPREAVAQLLTAMAAGDSLYVVEVPGHFEVLR